MSTKVSDRWREAVTVVAEGAILDPEGSYFEWKSELVSIEKCVLSQSKTNDSMVWA